MEQFKEHPNHESREDRHIPLSLISEISIPLYARAVNLDSENKRLYTNIRSSLDMIAYTDPGSTTPIGIPDGEKVLATKFEEDIVDIIDNPPPGNDTEWPYFDNTNRTDHITELFDSANYSDYAVAGIGQAIVNPDVSFNTKATLLNVFVNGEYDLPQLSEPVMRLAKQLTTTAKNQRTYQTTSEGILIEPQSKTILLSHISYYLDSVVKRGR